MPIVRDLVGRFTIVADPSGSRKVETQITRIGRQAQATGVRIQSSANQFVGALQKKFTGLGQAFKSSPLAQLATFGALAAGLKTSVTSAAALEETMSKLSQVFGANSAEVEEFASRAAAATGRSRTDFLNYANDIQTVVQPMLGVGKASTDMSTKLAMLAVDLASFNDEADADVLTALRSGLIGSTEPLRRFGIVLTQASLQEFALSQGINKSLKSMTEQEKVMLRFQFIMARSNKAQGDAERTSGSFTNKVKGLQAAMGDLGEAIGGIFIGATGKDFIGGITSMIRAVESFFTDNKKGLQTILGLFSDLLPVLAAIGTAMFFAFVVPFVIANSGIIFLNALRVLIGLVVMDIIAFFQGKKSVVGAIGQAFVDVGKTIFNTIKNWIGFVKEAMGVLWSFLSVWFTKLFAQWGRDLDNFIDTLFEFAEVAAQAAMDMGKAIVDSGLEAMEDFAQLVFDAFTGAFDKVVDLFKNNPIAQWITGGAGATATQTVSPSPQAAAASRTANNISAPTNVEVNVNASGSPQEIGREVGRSVSSAVQGNSRRQAARFLQARAQ